MTTLVSAAKDAIREAWFTLSNGGQPAYRTDENGSLIPKSILEKMVASTTKHYGIVTQPNPYIEPDKPALAIA